MARITAEHGPRGVGQSSAALQRIHSAVIRANINRPVRTYGRRGIRDRRLRGCGPFFGAIGINGVKSAIHSPNINGAIRRNRRRRIGNAVGRGKSPFRRAVAVNPVKFAIAGPDINGAIAADAG